MALTKAGRYQIIGELGHGAMGIVYRGFDPTIGRTVAVKTVLLDTGDPELLKRFRREAQAAGILSHPNIVTIFDAGEDNGVFYIAMELVEGETLQQLMLRGPLAIEKTISIIEQVGAALDHAHERQIIHRDIKPANIMVSAGHAKVMDFGVAKMTAMGLTSTGQVLGTPSYMSPELVKGASVDGRSDIFSLGVVLYEMLTGAKPFVGENITTVIYKIIGEEPDPPARVNPALHSALDYVVLKALAKNPVERYQNCAEIAADLRNYQSLGDKARAAVAASGSVAASPRASSGTVVASRKELGLLQDTTPAMPRASSSSGRKPLFAAMGVVALALIAGAVWVSRRGGEDAPQRPAERVVVQEQPAPAQPPPPAEKTPAAGERAETAPAAGEPAAKAAAKPSAAKPPSAKRSEAPAPRPSESTAAPPAPAVKTEESARPSRTAAAMGRVSIHTDPKGAIIVVDGKPTPYRSPVNIAVPAGTYKIGAQLAGYSADPQEVVIRKDQMATVNLKLKADGGKRRFFQRFR